MHQGIYLASTQEEREIHLRLLLLFSVISLFSPLTLSGLKLRSCDGRMPQCLVCPGRVLTNISFSGRTAPPPPLPLAAQVQDN